MNSYNENNKLRLSSTHFKSFVVATWDEYPTCLKEWNGNVEIPSDTFTASLRASNAFSMKMKVILKKGLLITYIQ